MDKFHNRHHSIVHCLLLGLYCAGWLATGPRGVIVDTMTEAFKVGQTISNDLQRNLPPNGNGTTERNIET